MIQHLYNLDFNRTWCGKEIGDSHDSYASDYDDSSGVNTTNCRACLTTYRESLARDIAKADERLKDVPEPQPILHIYRVGAGISFCGHTSDEVNPYSNGATAKSATCLDCVIAYTAHMHELYLDGKARIRELDVVSVSEI